MTHRERFLAVLRGERPDCVPVVTRLDIWHTARRNAGTLPDEVAGLSAAEIEDRLGFGRSARLKGFCREVRDGVRETVVEEGHRTVRTLEVDGRAVREVRRRTAGQSAGGMMTQHAEFFLKTPDDYATLTRIWERTRIEIDHAAVARFDAEVGDAGLPLLVLGPMPFHRIMLEYAGYEQAYFHWADFPDAVAELAGAVERAYEAMWPDLARTRACMVLHGAHWSTDMTPAPLFRERLLPYARRFADAMHAAGKAFVFHADADLSGLLDLVLESGADVADCFACAPLVPLTLADARAAWGDRVIIWGGFPSTLLEPSAGEREFEGYLARFREQIAARRAIVVGVSDNVMPGALWGRIKRLASLTSGG